MNIETLKDELASDPLTVGYSGMDDAMTAFSLNDLATGRTLPVGTLEATTIYEAIDTAEFDALTTFQKASLDRILGLSGSILVDPGSKARAVILDAFGVDTNTRSALVARVTRDVSRATELGLPTVKVGHVEMARL